MKITVPLLRDATMLMLGAGGLVREFFLIGDRAPDRFRVGVCIALLMGPQFVLGIWQAWLSLRQPHGEARQFMAAPAPAATPVVESSSSPPSSSPSPPLSS